MTTAPKRDEKFYQTRRLLTFLPLFATPFLTVIFFILGGGKGQAHSSATSSTNPATTAGINAEIPKAVPQQVVTNKLEKQQIDSVHNRNLLAMAPTSDTAHAAAPDLAFQPAATSAKPAVDKSVEQAQQQLQQLQQQQAGAAQVNPNELAEQQNRSLALLHQQQNLENQRTQLELQRLSQRAAAVGVPVAASTSSAQLASKPKKAPETKVSRIDEDAVVSALGSGDKSGKGKPKPATASFHGFEEEEGEATGNTLPAVIHESQEVTSGSLIKMRLTEPAVVNGHHLPANTFIYGKASLNEERLNITIESLKSGNNIFPAELQVYDVDGLEGLHIPGAMSRDAVKQAGADGLGATSGIMTMSPNLATAAAGVAVNSVRSLGQRKIRLVKVRLKAGYNIMLKVDKDKNE